VAHAHFLEAIATIDRLVISRQKWHLILFATFSAGNGMHLTRSTISPAGRNRLLAALAAIRAAARLVEQSFLLVELLLTGGEDEVLPAFSTLKGLVLDHGSWASSGNLRHMAHWQIYRRALLRHD
jgi:hypothetical protein